MPGLSDINALIPDNTSGLVSPQDLRDAFAIMWAKDQYPNATTLYVDPDNGSDSSDGSTWDNAYATIQAAVSAIPSKGSEVILADTDHDVGSGVTWPRSSWPSTMHGRTELKSKQHADGTYRQARLISTAGTLPSAFITIPSGTGNLYGGTFRDFYWDGDDLAEGGFLFNMSACNAVNFQNISGRRLGTKGTVGFITSDSTGGDDASWLYFDRIVTMGMKLGYLNQSNYTYVSQTCMFFGDLTTQPAGVNGLWIKGSQPRIYGDFEGWEKAVYAYDCRGGNFAPTGESNDYTVYMDACHEATVHAESTAGSGEGLVMDFDGANNTVVGISVEVGGTTYGGHYMTRNGHSFTQLSQGSGVIRDGHPTLPNPGYELLPTMMHNYCQSTSPVWEYWNGSGWSAWSPTDQYEVQTENHVGPQLTSTYPRARVRFGSLYNGGNGLAYVKFDQPNDSINSITMRMINSDTTTVEKEFSVPVASPAQTRAVWASFPQDGNATYFEVEFDTNLTSTHTMTVQQIALYTPEMNSNNRGRVIRGNQDPEGKIWGRIGDIYISQNYQTSASGIYEKMTNATNTGWEKLLRIPTTPDSVGSAATDAATTQTLANNLRTALINLGLAQT